MPPQQIIWFIIGTVIILFGAYYVTYYVGMKASGKTRAGLRNRNIAVHDNFSIARDKGFCVVEIAGKVYIVAVAANAVTLLDTYDAEEFAERTKDTAAAQIPWSDTPVGRYGNKITKKVVAFFAAKRGLSNEESGISNEESGIRNEELGINNEESGRNKKQKADFNENMKKASEGGVIPGNVENNKTEGD